MKQLRAGLAVLLVSVLGLGVYGCVTLVIGGAAGALGAYAVSKDTIQGDTDKPYERLWDSAIVVARSRGTIKADDKARGYLEFEEGPAKVTVRLTKLTRHALRLTVTARRHHLPDINLAQDVYVRIFEGVQ